jgi:hypothetical protein
MDMAYTGRLLRYELIRVCLPPKLKTLPFQPSSLLNIFSLIGSQSATCNLEPAIGTPRYLMGHCPIAQLNILENSKLLVSS